MKVRANNAENYSGVWRRVEGPMKTIFHRKADRRDYFPMVQSVVWSEKQKWWWRQDSGLWCTEVAVEAVVLLTTTAADDTQEDKTA